MQFENPPFPLDSNLSDRQNVLNFVEKIPEIIRRIFEEPHSNLLDIIENDSNTYGISKTLFLASFEEAKAALTKQLEANNLPYDLDDKLSEAGFTGNSLKLKSALLNKLWKQVVSKCNLTNTPILDFSSNLFGPIRRFIEKFLQFLNSLLGSLLDGLPGVEQLKELKEFLEQYINEEDDDD